MPSKQNRANTGWVKLAAWCALVVIILSACSQAVAPTTAPQPATQSGSSSSVGQTPAEASPTAAPTSTQPPTATVPPTATPTQVPTATATELPTATPVPALAVLPDGFDVWCAPVSYAGTVPTSADPVADARKLAVTNNQLQVLIPAAYCSVVVRFNQAAPADAQLYFYDSGSPFIKTALKPVDGHPDEAWATIRHGYVVNPPLWQATYALSVVDGKGQELWKNNIKFYKDMFLKCPYGDTPDPVTLYCAVTDPWEIEPHPDATYPYDHDHLPTEEP